MDKVEEKLWKKIKAKKKLIIKNNILYKDKAFANLGAKMGLLWLVFIVETFNKLERLILVFMEDIIQT